MDLVDTVVRKIRENDNFGRMVGIKVGEAREGYARVLMEVEDRHLNSVGITHGGAIFTLADLAFAIASNSHGKVALALNMNINFLKATGLGTHLIATAEEEKVTNRTGLYRIVVEDESGDTVAVAQGLAYRKS